jgi:hypothetical protein
VNTWQCLRQLQYLLRGAKWEASSNVVFHSDSVIVSAAPREETIEKVIMPLIVLRPGGATIETQPDFLNQEVLITLGVSHAGDAFGEAPLLGMQRSSQELSPGRGLLEIEEEVFGAIDRLNTDAGIVVQHRASGAVQAAYVSGQYLAFRDYMFVLDVTASRFYHAAMNLEAA